MNIYCSNFLILNNTTCPNWVNKFDFIEKLPKDGFLFGCFEDIQDVIKLNSNIKYSCWNLSVSSFAPFLSRYFINHDGYYKQVCQLNENDIGNFCRSDSGKKVWSGQIIKDEFLLRFMKETLLQDEMMFLCNRKEIKNEVRFWIKDQKIISFSPYDAYDKTDFSFKGKSIRPYVKFVKFMIDYWEPDSMYVVDIGEHQNKLYVVEYNCYSSSGFYNANIKKIMESVNEN